MATVLTAIIVVLVHYEINRKHLKTYYTNSSVRALGSFENLGGGKILKILLIMKKFGERVHPVF
jgi:hypothetical protein